MSSNFITKTKPFLYGNGDINVLYGPWNSIEDFITNATDSFGLSSIAIGTTIAIRTESGVEEFWNMNSTNVSASSFEKKSNSGENVDSILQDVENIRQGLNGVNTRLDESLPKIINVEDYCEEGQIMPADANIYMLGGRPALLRLTIIGSQVTDEIMYVASDYVAKGDYPNLYIKFVKNSNGWAYDSSYNNIETCPFANYFNYNISKTQLTVDTSQTDATIKIEDNSLNTPQSIQTTIPAATAANAGLMTSEMYQTLSNVSDSNPTTSIAIQITDTTYSTSTELDQNYPNMSQGGMVVYPGTSAGGDSYLYIKINNENWIVFNGTQVGTTAAPTARIIGASVLSYK